MAESDESNKLINYVDSSNTSNLNHQEFSIKKGLIEISWIAFPSVLYFAAIFIKLMINKIFVLNNLKGEDKINALNAMGIADLYVNSLFFSFLYGITSSGFEILGSNAYGLNKIRLFVIFFQRSQIIGLIFFVLLYLFHFFISKAFLSIFKIEESIFNWVIQYLRLNMIASFFEVLFWLNTRFFNLIRKSHINIIFIMLGIIMHPLWCYLFITKLQMGIIGASISLILTYFLETFAGYLYIHITKPIEISIFSYSKDSFKEWNEYLKVSLPAALAFFSKFVGLEILAVVAIMTGKIEYSVYVIINDIYYLLCSFCLSFGNTTTILTSKYIVNKNIEFIKKYWKLLYASGLICVIFCTTIFFIFRYNIVWLFIDEDANIINLTINIFPLLFHTLLLDYTQQILLCILRGLKKHLISFPIVLITLFFIQTLISWYFGIHLKWGAYGVFLGISCSSLILIICFTLLLYNFDIEEIKLKAIEDIKHAEKSLEIKATDLDEFF